VKKVKYPDSQKGQNCGFGDWIIDIQSDKRQKPKKKMEGGKKGRERLSRNKPKKCEEVIFGNFVPWHLQGDFVGEHQRPQVGVGLGREKGTWAPTSNGGTGRKNP